MTPLELFFDLVFVLAITQCTALMSHHPTWAGLAQGLLVLGVLWWSWTGYAWLTSVVDPEEGAVRHRDLRGDGGAPDRRDLRAGGLRRASRSPSRWPTASVRAAHIALFMLASRDDAAPAPLGHRPGVSTAIGVGLLVGASLLDGLAQGALWALALLLDMGGPYLFGSEGWKLVPGHFAERHGLIIIIALGESIVAIGVGAAGAPDVGHRHRRGARRSRSRPRCGGSTSTSSRWSRRGGWSARRGPRAQNELARDSYSYLHFPMVAGIVLVALGLKKTLGHVDDPLDTVPAFALLGGVAFYLLGLRRLPLPPHPHDQPAAPAARAVLLFALLPAAVELPALATLALVTALLCAMIAYETIAATARGATASATRSSRPSGPLPKPARAR